MKARLEERERARREAAERKRAEREAKRFATLTFQVCISSCPSTVGQSAALLSLVHVITGSRTTPQSLNTAGTHTMVLCPSPTSLWQCSTLPHSSNQNPPNPSRDPPNPSQHPPNPSQDPPNPSQDLPNPSQDPPSPSLLAATQSIRLLPWSHALDSLQDRLSPMPLPRSSQLGASGMLHLHTFRPSGLFCPMLTEWRM